MKTGTTLATALFALASLPLLAQQPSPANQPNSPATQPATQQNPPSAAPATSPAASPETSTPNTSTAEMSPVNGELVSKLDSKTAKTGDNVVVKTETSIKTADGTEIPKGSKLIGHIIAVQPSGAGTNSQVALQFDHVELKGGQSVSVHSQIQSIAPPGGAASTGDSAAMASGPAAAGASNRSMSGPTTGSSRASAAPQATNSDPGTAPAAGNGAPAAGTVVAKNGNIAISTTSIPGVLLANNAPGEQDPRMASASSILLGAKKDIQLDGGTQMVVGLSAAGGGTR